jgi:Holliday junction resolvase
MPANKAKGSKAERDLVKMFTEHGWRAVRVAGSGVGDESPCDILAAKANHHGFTVECKSSKKTTIYITKEQINDFVLFSHMIGLTPVLAAKFNYEGWLFISPDHLKDTGKYWALSLKTAKEKGKRFSQFFESEDNSVQ